MLALQVIVAQLQTIVEIVVLVTSVRRREHVELQTGIVGRIPVMNVNLKMLVDGLIGIVALILAIIVLLPALIRRLIV